jgi:cell division protein FtsW (lipid II flippase)
LALSTTPVAGTLSRERVLAWPLLLESALVVAVIAAMLPWFGPMAEQPAGGDGRFAAPAVAIRGLPGSVLRELCAAYAAFAEDSVREGLCGRTATTQRNPPLDRLPPALPSASTRATQAFVAPLQDAQTGTAALRQRQREGTGDLVALGDEIARISAEIQSFIDRYAIGPGDSDGPRPLACAFAQVQSAFNDPSARGEARANSVLLLAAALDGHPATASLAKSASLRTPRIAKSRCTGVRLPDAFAALSPIMSDARAAPLGAAKNKAMRGLLGTAGYQWAGWSLAGLLLLQLGRRSGPAAPRLALALVVWALAAWIGAVPWPLASGTSIVFARDTALRYAMPAAFVLWFLGAALCVLAAAPLLRRKVLCSEQAPVSVFAYPGLVVATGFGWLLLLDLSANGHVGGRYLALYHHGHLWLGMLTFSVIAILRQPLGRALAWTLSVVDGLAGRVASRLSALGVVAMLVALALALMLAVGTLLVNVRQLTSEIGRLWLIVGAAWFFFLRGTPLTERLARSGSSTGSLLRYMAPLLFVVAVLVGAMLITRDMGPLLIAGYGAGAFIAASMAMWWYQRRGAIGSAYALAVMLFVAWLLAVTFALLRLGSIDEVTAARLENVAAPLASANDHLALVTWFQRAAPTWGFGPGGVPWCGFGVSAACAGVPAQIQSDYTFTAVTGMFGWTAALALTLGCALWLNEMIRGHARATRGEPRLIRFAGRMSNDEQAFVSWISVAWIALTLCQLAVTVAGNVAVIPLTGVTFPFVSFGMTSLVMNMVMLAFAVNVNAGKGSANG